MEFVCWRIFYINIASRNIYALVGESQSKPLRSEEKHEISFERAKNVMPTAIQTNHFNTNEKLFVCLETSDGGTGTRTVISTSMKKK